MSDEDSVFLKEGYFIVLALVLAFGILQFSGTVMGTEKPVVSVISCSMYPEYDRGDVLAVNGVNFKQIEEDDVIVYQVPLEVEIELDNERVTVTEQASNTPIGESKVLAVQENQALLEIDGERLRVRNSGSYTVNGERVTIREVSGMDTPVVHRVTEKRNDSLETKGDNNPQQLEFEKDIRPEQVHGKVFFRIPKVGAVKLVAMDFVGLTGRPLVIDSYRGCS
ncbi:MAG: hypothetical protein R6V35_01185 [Candidatus Nanohaloarchaea archaeon]